MSLFGSIRKSAKRWLRRDEAHRHPRRRRAPRAFERVESRQLLAANIHLGAVYYEDAAGEDLAPDLIEITWTGGAPGTQLTRLVIDTDKLGDGLTIGDVFFDTEVGGLGAFGASPFRIVRADGIDSVQVQVADGGTQLILTFVGFHAGDKLVFSIDVDEMGFLGPNAVAEGNEFEGSRMTGTFEAAHFYSVSGTGMFLDAYDASFAGLGLDLPPDAYVPPAQSPQPVRTAGALVAVEQVALPISIRGTVYEDVDLDRTRDTGEPGIAGVTLSLDLWNGSSYQTVATTTTDAQGRYRFDGVQPGRYRVVETQPSGYFSVSASAGAVNGQTRGRVDTVDVIADIDLLGGEDSINNDFGESRPVSLSGYVYHDADNDGVRDAGEQGIAGVLLEVRRRAANGTFLTVPLVVVTNAQGFWIASGLEAGEFDVREMQPAGYLDGLDSVGSAGGQLVAPGDHVTNIRLLSGVAGINYNFGELLPSSISGRVLADADGDCEYDPGERWLSGVTIYLLDANGKRIDSTTTDSEGRYEFTGLAPGVYGVEEVQPPGLFDGGDHVGSAGGRLVGPDSIVDILLVSGTIGVNYDFCEIEPVSICGFVYVDDNQNGQFDAGEQPLAGVVIELLDASGNRTGRTVLTDASGFYCFDGLEPGVYGVEETQPAGYFDGLDSVGTAGGTAANPGDRITGAQLLPGVHGKNYNFGELRPASLQGLVHADRDGDCVYDPGEEEGLPGVVIELLDAEGRVIQTTLTDAAGRYAFKNLAPGVYGVREIQPQGYFQGATKLGTHGGVVTAQDWMTQIVLGSGANAANYDFCEKEPVGIAGRVWADLDGDCLFDPGEQPLSGVVIELLDAAGNLVATTTTAADGRYVFENFMPGEYQVRERQPLGYFQGGQVVGSAGGTVLGADHIGQIQLAPGVLADGYDFCELLPASLSGQVYVDFDGDCIRDPDEPPLAGVVIELYDAVGNLVATTTTGADGAYLFHSIYPGVYSVREIQPEGYFQGGTVVGSAGGVAGEDRIEQIRLAPDVKAVGYDFCERLPGKISGYVFRDGPPISYNQGDERPDPASVRDGIRTADDQPIAGVILLLTYTGGEPVLDAAGQQRMAVTDANGYYEFDDLAPGSYTVFQVQPIGYEDFWDTPGTTGGLVANRNEPVPAPLLLYDHNYDVVAFIAVDAGAASVENNFAEVQYQELPVGPPVDLPPPTQPERIAPLLAPLNAPRLAPTILPLAPPLTPDFYTGGARAYTWHLSVINGGAPRRARPEAGTPAVPVVARATAFAWGQQNLGRGRFIIRQGKQLKEIRFGHPDGLPVAGDFNGDGRAEVGVFIDGQWFIDRNGNGRFDADDLWAELGKRRDEPVVGDWDGDGKADIGIFGPAWARDARAIAAEPGLPDGHNQHNTKPKNLPPTRDEATLPERLLKQTAAGSMRSDFVDHVFQWGFAGDIPVVGDWNGEGIASIGVFRSGLWQLDTDGDGRLTEADLTLRFGQPGDIPVVGDWNGDGRTELGVYRRGRWHLDSNGNRQVDDADETFELGGPDDLPIAADFDGDGIDDAAVYEVDAGQRGAPEA